MRYLKLLIMLGVCSIIFLTACSKENDRGGADKEEGVNQKGDPMGPEEFSNAFLSGNYEKVYAQMSKDFKKEISLKELRGLAEEFNQGIDTYILQSELPFGDGVRQYAWTDDSGTKGMVAIFDEDNIILGLRIMPLTTYPDTDEIYSKTVFEVPFQDKWFVFWGGTNSIVNYHYDYENQRYAYDFVIMNEHTTYEGDPTLNESYYAFGKEYLAPADGTVVKVESNIIDNEPVGKMNEKEPLGNYVIIDHGNDEFSYLAHFKHQSIEVKEGDKVKQGDLLGLVGNSGNSSEPHIHFHVADSPDPMESKSIRIQFKQDEAIIQGDWLN